MNIIEKDNQELMDKANHKRKIRQERNEKLRALGFVPITPSNKEGRSFRRKSKGSIARETRQYIPFEEDKKNKPGVIQVYLKETFMDKVQRIKRLKERRAKK